MHPSRGLMITSLLTCALTAAAAAAGLFWTSAGAPFDVVSARGLTVTVYGQGLYFYDSLFSAPLFRGTDLVTLVIAVPMLLAALWYGRHGSLRGTVLVASVLGYCVYYAVSVAFGVQYNNLLLLYTAMLPASMSAFVLALSSIDLAALDKRLAPNAPRRAVGRFLVFAGLVVAGVWLSGLIPALLDNTVPEVLDHYTTIVTYPIDLGIIAPACVYAGVLMLRRQTIAGLFAAPLLTMCALIGLVVVSQTVFQLSAGVELSPGEVAIYVVSFLLLAAVAAWLAVAYFRSIPADHVPDAPFERPLRHSIRQER